MKKSLPESASLAKKVLPAVRALAIRLQAETLEATQKLAHKLSGTGERLARAVDAHQAAQEARKAASARIRARDKVRDKALSALELDLLAEVGKDRSHSSYRKVFGRRSLTDLVDLSVEQENLEQRGIIAILDDPELAAVAGHKASLQGTLADVEQAVAEREAAYQAENASRRELDLAGDAALKAYNQAWFTLNELYADEKGKAKGFYA